MWIRHSSASCLCLCLCSCLVSLVLIAAEIACRQAIRLSLPKPQATPFLLPFSPSTFGACGRWQRAFLNGALNKLPTATKFANLPCSLSLSVVPFLPFSDSSDSSTFYPKSCTKCPTCVCVCLTNALCHAPKMNTNLCKTVQANFWYLIYSNRISLLYKDFHVALATTVLIYLDGSGAISNA